MLAATSLAATRHTHTLKREPHARVRTCLVGVDPVVRAARATRRTRGGRARGQIVAKKGPRPRHSLWTTGGAVRQWGATVRRARRRFRSRATAHGVRSRLYWGEHVRAPERVRTWG